jgi:hypothetical protein
MHTPPFAGRSSAGLVEAFNREAFSNLGGQGEDGGVAARRLQSDKGKVPAAVGS